jgi:hypothetical protein
MPAPRIFISHSSADDPALVLSLHDALNAAGFRVLLDRTRLAGGDDWRNEIYTWISRAHGAVVLLSEVALRSRWVRYELTALTQRRWFDADFRLIPVVVPPVTTAALHSAELDPHNLRALQAVSLDAHAPRRFDGIVDLFRPLLTTFSDTPVDRLETTVAKELPPEPDVLERAARLLGQSHDDDERACDPTAVARSMFHAAVETVRDALAEIAGGRVSRSQIRKIVDIVLPFWVDPQATIELAREAAAPAGPHRILLLNSTHPFLGKLYAQRAALQYPLKWELVPVTTAGGDDLVGSVVAELRDHFRQIDALLDGASNEEIDTDIENTATMDPVIVIIVGGATSAHLSELRNRYPRCIFLALVGAQLPSAAMLAAHRMSVLNPPISSEREQTIRSHYLACYRLVSNTSAQE